MMWGWHIPSTLPNQYISYDAHLLKNSVDEPTWCFFFSIVSRIANLCYWELIKKSDLAPLMAVQSEYLDSKLHSSIHHLRVSTCLERMPRFSAFFARWRAHASTVHACSRNPYKMWYSCMYSLTRHTYPHAHVHIYIAGTRLCMRRPKNDQMKQGLLRNVLLKNNSRNRQKYVLRLHMYACMCDVHVWFCAYACSDQCVYFLCVHSCRFYLLIGFWTWLNLDACVCFLV